MSEFWNKEMISLLFGIAKLFAIFVVIGLLIAMAGHWIARLAKISHTPQHDAAEEGTRVRAEKTKLGLDNGKDQQ